MGRRTSTLRGNMWMCLTIIALCVSAGFVHGYTDGSVRRGGYYGFLEIYHDGEWGPICAGKHGWNRENTKVACHMLDDKYGWSFSYNNTESTKALLRNIECIGNENNIEDCRHDGWGKYNCPRLVKIYCIGKFPGTACSGRVCEDHQNNCCVDIRGFSHCCTTTTSTTTKASYNDNSHKWVISFRWWWIAAVFTAVAVLAAITLRLVRYCRTQQRLRARCHTDGRQDVTLPHGGVHRAAVLPYDLPPSYSDVSKVSRPTTTGGKRNPTFQHSESPPPLYSTIET